MSLSVAVMAHPSRAAMVEELVTQLDRPATIVWDKVNDRHDTGIRALEAYDPACTHHLVIQDDSVPCRDLVAGIERAMRYVPTDHPASFYLGRVRPFARQVQAVVDRAGDASWITMDGIYWGPAIVVPTAAAPFISHWWRTRKAQQTKNYDRRTSHWFQMHGLRCWYSWPSLVDHRGDESLSHGSVSERRAHRFLGDTESALTVDWSGPVVEMTRTDRLDRQRQQNARTANRRRVA